MVQKKRDIGIVGLALAIAVTLLVAFAANGCGVQGVKNEVKKEQTAATLDEKVEGIVVNMTPAEKVGQMMMIGIQGDTVTDDSLYMLHQYHIGGVILFDRNLVSAEQTKNLNEDLQVQAEEKVPLFIGIDEEGGDVVRGRSFIQPPSSQRQIGAAGDLTAAEGAANRTAKELKELGFNVNFAPVADVGASSRSFSTDPETVKKFVLASVQGYEKNRMIYAMKHFPGIGRSTVDSHKDVSEITASRERLAASDIVPFKAVIDAAQPEDYFILVSHLKYPAYDADNPASLSKAVQTDLLRGELGYRGIIVTDDMEMGAVAKYAAFRDVGVRAVQAGADIVLVCHEYAHETDVYLGLLDAVESGEIPMERIDESVRRIVKAKLLHKKNGEL